MRFNKNIICLLYKWNFFSKKQDKTQDKYRLTTNKKEEEEEAYRVAMERGQQNANEMQQQRQQKKQKQKQKIQRRVEMQKPKDNQTTGDKK